jgi:hypothetical protein
MSPAHPLLCFENTECLLAVSGKAAGAVADRACLLGAFNSDWVAGIEQPLYHHVREEQDEYILA